MRSKISPAMLFEENVGLVAKIVNRMDCGFVSRDDLMQAGLMGLHKAALNYDPDLGVKFTTFAVYHVVGAIKAELRENRLIRMNRKLFRILAALRADPAASPDAIAVRLDVSREEVIIAYSYLDGVFSLNQTGADRERELLDAIPAPERRAWLEEALSSLPAFDREIIILRYFKNCTQAEVARLKNESQSSISRAEARALAKMRAYLLASGVQV